MKNINLKDKKIILSIIALITFILKKYGLFDNIGLDEAGWNELTDIILTFLMAIGIFTNPNKTEGDI